MGSQHYLSLASIIKVPIPNKSCHIILVLLHLLQPNLIFTLHYLSLLVVTYYYYYYYQRCVHVSVFIYNVWILSNYVYDGLVYYLIFRHWLRPLALCNSIQFNSIQYLNGNSTVSQYIGVIQLTLKVHHF
jgi:glycosyltransferase involved in cell wall biosynthesis